MAKLSVPEWNQYISGLIQGGFFEMDMMVQREEIEKLEDDDVYLEVGVDEGKSLSTARYYAKDTVWTIGVDYIDPPARAPYMNIKLGHFPNGTGMISHGKKTMFIHGDSQMVAKVWTKPISLLFIDGDHSYEGVKKDHESWVPHVKKGGVILYHDYDHPDVKRFLDETYGKNMEICHGKVVRVKV